jgi:hypothetical protein
MTLQAMASRRTLERGSQGQRTRPIALCSAPLGGMDPVELQTLVCLFETLERQPHFEDYG